MKLLITDDSLRTLKLPEGKAQLVVFDTKLSGFAVLVGKSSIAFTVRMRANGAIHSETLGRWVGRGGDMTVVEARKRAKVRIGDLTGNRPTPGKVKRASKGGPTLADAATAYLAEMTSTDCRPTSIECVRREIADVKHGYLGVWLDRPLVSITGKECRAMHELIARKNGPHVANRVLREFRAIWNHTAKEASLEGATFPTNPTIAVKWIVESSKTDFVARRAEPIADDDLPAWHAAVMKIRNTVRRDYQLVVIYTGLRRRDAASLRWEHINLTSEPVTSRVWHAGREKWEPVTLAPMSILRPAPKGGSDAAFELPLSSQCAAVLTARRADNMTAGRNDHGWVFPTAVKKHVACYSCADLGIVHAHVEGGVTHMSEPRQFEVDELVSPHRLRDTYVTALGKTESNHVVIKLLVNHSLGKTDVTLGYMRLGVDDLRAAQQRVSDRLVATWTVKLHSVPAASVA